MIEIHEIRKEDYPKARQFAIVGMHFNWYMDSKAALDLYSRYFWDLEMNRATRVYGAYAGGKFVGCLLVVMKGEKPLHHSIWKTIYAKIFDVIQYIVAGNGVGAYDNANADMMKEYLRNNSPDGEIAFLAADPDCEIKGIGTALLSALERDEKGKQVYLYTDNACTYQFYEHRGFSRAEEREIVLKLDKDKEVPLQCFLYSRRL